MPSGLANASEFDVVNDGPPKESYVVDDAGVLSRVTKSDLKRLLTDLESRKNFRINFITVRKLTVSLVSSYLFSLQKFNACIIFECFQVGFAELLPFWCMKTELVKSPIKFVYTSVLRVVHHIFIGFIFMYMTLEH